MILPLLMLACTWTAAGPPTKEVRVVVEAPPQHKGYVVRALGSWAAVADVKFILVENSPDLTIRKGVLGECGLNGLVGGFTTDKEIVIRDWEDPRLHSYLLHEIGHWLGLSHTDNRASVMFPIISEQRYEDVGTEDVEKIVEKLGAAELNKWTVFETLTPFVHRIWGIGKVPKGAVGRGWNWSGLCGGELLECLNIY